MEPEWQLASGPPPALRACPLHPFLSVALAFSNFTVTDNQSPAIKFKFVFFSLQMLCFLALRGPNEQKFVELLTCPKVISPPIFFPNLFTEIRETQHLKAKKHKLKFNGRTLLTTELRARARLSLMSVPILCPPSGLSGKFHRGRDIF